MHEYGQPGSAHNNVQSPRQILRMEAVADATASKKTSEHQLRHGVTPLYAGHDLRTTQCGTAFGHVDEMDLSQDGAIPILAIEKIKMVKPKHV